MTHDPDHGPDRDEDLSDDDAAASAGPFAPSHAAADDDLLAAWQLDPQAPQTPVEATRPPAPRMTSEPQATDFSPPSYSDGSTHYPIPPAGQDGGDDLPESTYGGAPVDPDTVLPGSYGYTPTTVPGYQPEPSGYETAGIERPAFEPPESEIPRDETAPAGLPGPQWSEQQRQDQQWSEQQRQDPPWPEQQRPEQQWPEQHRPDPQWPEQQWPDQAPADRPWPEQPSAPEGSAVPPYEPRRYDVSPYEQPLQYPIPPAAQAPPQGVPPHAAPHAAGPGAPPVPYGRGPQGYGPGAPGGQGAPPAPPKPEDLLVPPQSPVTSEPASWGWRGKVNRATGGLFKPKAAEGELRVRQAITDVQHGFTRPMTVVVVQPKGGAGKTPTTICLSAAFGAHRGGYVVGWDDNETRGTLAVRVSNPDGKRTTVWDLLGDLDQFERSDARVGDLSAYVRSQPDAHFDALVSDDNPGNMAQIGEAEFRRLHTVLQRFYRMIVIDTGNNVRSSNWQAAVDAADMVVVVSTYQRDVGYSGSWVLDHLAQTGREALARNAVTILTAADPTIDKTVREQLLQHFRSRTQAVTEIPYDPELAHGGPIRWGHLGLETRNAWIEAGALIVNRLADSDSRAVQARRH